MNNSSYSYGETVDDTHSAGINNIRGPFISVKNIIISNVLEILMSSQQVNSHREYQTVKTARPFATDKPKAISKILMKYY